MSAPKSISGSESEYRKWTHYFRFISFWPMLSLRIYDDLLFSRKPFFSNIPGRFIAHRPSIVLRHPSVSCACQENSGCAFRDAIIIIFIYVYNLYSPSSVVIFFLGNEGVSSVQCWYSYQKQKPPTPYLWEIVLFQ